MLEEDDIEYNEKIFKGGENGTDELLPDPFVST